MLMRALSDPPSVHDGSSASHVMPFVYTWMNMPFSLQRLTAARNAASPSRGGQKFGKPVS